MVHEVPVMSKQTQQEADVAIKNMLADYPNAKVVFMTNVDWGVLMAGYVRRYRPDVEVVTIDFTREIQEIMSDNSLQYAIGQRNYSWGTMSFDFLNKHFNHRPVERYVDTGTYEVNRQNINIYKRML